MEKTYPHTFIFTLDSEQDIRGQRVVADVDATCISDAWSKAQAYATKSFDVGKLRTIELFGIVAGREYDGFR